MSITFTISNQPAAVPGQELSHTFTDGGTIGRTRTCDWVLIDASRFISGKHAVISEQNGTYQITDTSTNGVFINEAKVPLGKGNSAILNQGDKLKIGEYIISVAIDGQEAVTDRFQAGFGQQQPPLQQDLMAGIGSSGEPVDPLELFNEPKKAAAAQPPPIPPAADSGLIPSSKPEPIYPSVSQEDHAESVHNHFEPPNIIPDNWIEEDQSKKPSSGKTPQPQIPPIAEIPQKTRDNMTGSGMRPATPSAQFQKPSQAPDLSNGTSGFFRKKKVKKPSRAATGGGGPPSAVSNQVVQSFLAGLGVENIKLTTEQLPSFMRIVGECVRECISGTFNVLRSRTNIKSEFRMSMTTIQAAENNPLKFSVNVDEAVRNMFLNTSESYLPPTEAIREGFEDIEGHQLAVMAGTQAAIIALLRRFDPQYLEEIFDSSKSRSGILGGGKKAKYWDSYEDYYQEIAARVEDNFQNMFGDEFAQAYENQVQRLLSSRRKPK